MSDMFDYDDFNSPEEEDKDDCNKCIITLELSRRVKELEDGLRQIAIWTQADEDDHKLCALQWRGCVGIARNLLKKKVY